MPAETIPPIYLTDGMVCASPKQLTPPSVSEQLFNYYYDRSGNLRTRPGSVFHTRLGDGPVLGLHEHTFETGVQAPVIAAVCAGALSTAWGLVQTGEGAAGADARFFPDCGHGEDGFVVLARETDRFTMASLFNRIYLSGSTVARQLHYYDYAARMFAAVAGISARGCLGHRQRLWAWGDPNNPNYLYPSNFAEPETFRAELALQIGSQNAEILLCIEAFDRVIVGTSRGIWHVDAYSVEDGDVSIAAADVAAGIAGPRAMCEAGSFIYGFDPALGPWRWALGMQAVDTGFASRVAPLFRRINAIDRELVTVDYDVEHDCVHFGLSLAGNGYPDYQVSFSLTRDAWTHSGHGTDTSMLGSLPIPATNDTRYIGAQGFHGGFMPGRGFYTVMLSRIDPSSGGGQVLIGDENGYLWRTSWHSEDRCRGNSGLEGFAFVRLWRSGTWQLSALGRVSMVHRVLLALEAYADYSYEWRVEQDFSRVFTRTHQRSLDEYDELGTDWILGAGESLLRPSQPFPYLDRIPLWRHAIARTIRYEMETQSPMVLLGIEHERSQTAR